MSRSALLLAGLAAQAQAFWRLPCGKPVSVQRADPIVDPGAVSAHVHTVMGSNAFNFTMEEGFQNTATCTTCKAKEDMSSYWTPNLWYRHENGSFTSVEQNGGALIYYLQREDPKDPLAGEEGLLAFPPNFRMISGDPFLRSYKDTLEQRAISFVCLGVDGPQTQELPKQNCPDGLRAQVNFPSCWNGKLDSDDHKSHMAFPSGMDSGHCPQSHPHRFITLFYEVTFNVDDFADMWYGDGDDGSQPFVFSNGDPTGYGFHGDFLSGWDRPTLQSAVDDCTAESGVIEECPHFTLLDDDTLNLCAVPPRIHEEVSGTLDSLPGCNPMTPGPAKASKQCLDGETDDATIGAPIFPYTDVAASEGWAWVTCAKDPYGETRTLDGEDSDSGDDMTVESCVQFCGGKGYKFAGVEYGRECYCGNDGVADDRLYPEGLRGSCDMPCSGDAGEMCGAGSEIAVYKKCDGSKSECRNAAWE